MKNDKRIIKYFIIFILLIIIIMTSILFAKNIELKQNLKKNKWITPILNQDETEKLIVKNNPDVKITYTGEKGLWDKKGIKKLELQHKLSMSYVDGDTNTIFHQVTDVKSDQEGNIYVSEFSDGRIRKFNCNGTYQLTLGRKGKGPGEFLGPLVIYFDDNGILSTVDWGLSRISFFGKNGVFINSFNLNKAFGNTMFQGFISDQNGSFFISHFDRVSDKVIHEYNDKGEHIKSFGESGKLKQPMKYIDYTIKSDISRGEMALVNNHIFYSQSNPYLIYIYNINGTLDKVIFRNNAFMPPAKYQITGKNRYKTRVSAITTMIGAWDDIIINCVYVPFYISKKVGCVIDIYTTEGQLLTSLPLENHILFNDIDEEGNLYGCELIGEYDDEQIVVYSLKIL